jgi:hypothetical protein
MTNIDDDSYSVVEERAAAAVNNVDFEERIISIIAVPWEQSTRVEYRNEVWNEIFTRGSFDGIENRQRRIPVTAVLHTPNVGHDGGHLVGKVAVAFPGHPDGLGLDVRISNTPAGDETLQLALDDALSPSVGFMARPADHRLDRRSMTRRINRAFLDHLAFVPQPAYAGAKILGVRDSGRAVDAATLPPIITPAIDEYLADPIFGWAAKRFE